MERVRICCRSSRGACVLQRPLLRRIQLNLNRCVRVVDRTVNLELSSRRILKLNRLLSNRVYIPDRI